MGPDESARMVRADRKRCARRCTVLLIEHDMDAVFRLADRITVLVGGRVMPRHAGRVRGDPEVQAAYLGNEAQGLA